MEVAGLVLGVISLVSKTLDTRRIILSSLKSAQRHLEDMILENCNVDDTSNGTFVEDGPAMPQNLAVSYRLLALIAFPNLNKVHGTGSKATAMNPNILVAHPTPRLWYI